MVQFRGAGDRDGPETSVRLHGVGIIKAPNPRLASTTYTETRLPFLGSVAWMVTRTVSPPFRVSLASEMTTSLEKKPMPTRYFLAADAASSVLGAAGLGGSATAMGFLPLGAGGARTGTRDGANDGAMVMVYGATEGILVDGAMVMVYGATEGILVDGAMAGILVDGTMAGAWLYGAMAGLGVWYMIFLTALAIAIEVTNTTNAQITIVYFMSRVLYHAKKNPHWLP